ncbi:MAG: bifunctional 4-hydroxy-2-oxoglutarate aldolase/2-dehydro-3-deoxy-phosphogluconate aldolase [Clostridiales bacterium]|nr:bifunctional 4-hydroxy-2-oxoglutarate aldolase/2-dehydro-3-deoxy-phosphogluconate aldolase [Clostridiales bacterium]
MQDIIKKILDKKIIAIVRRMDESLILPLAHALSNGGIELIEITFNQADPSSFASTAKAISAIRDNLQGRVIPGAGTVLSPEQVRMAAEAGARYIVSPNADIATIKETKRLGLISLPGALTPTEAASAHDAGADFVKIFPAGDLGPGYIKAIRAPLSHIKFLAVGGISEKNAADYIRAGAVGLGIGGNLVNKSWIEEGKWHLITELAQTLVECVK